VNISPQHPYAAPDPPGQGEEGAESLFGGLQRQLQVVFRHKILIFIVTALGAAGGYYYLTQQTPVYRASTRVMIDRTPPKILSNVKEVVELGTPAFFGSDPMYFQSQYEIIKSTGVAERVLDRLNLWNSEHLLRLDQSGQELSEEEKRQAIADTHMPTVLASRILVRPIQKSMLVSISFEDSDKEFAQKVVNAVAVAYKEQNIAHKKKIVTDATKELELLAQQWKTQLNTAETATRAFEEKHSVGTIPNTRKAIDRRLEQLSLQITRTSILKSRLKSKVSSVRVHKKGKRRGTIRASVILQDPTVQSLKRQIAELGAKLAGLETRYLDRHPDVAATKKQLKSLRRSLRRQIASISATTSDDYRQAKRMETDLQQKLETAKKEELRIAHVEREYARLTEIQQKTKARYEEINKRYIEATMSVQVATNNVRVIDPAVSAIQVRPRRMLVMGGALLLAFILALLLAYLVENADVRIRGWQEIEALGLKVIGVLPVIAKEGLMRRNPGKEALRNRDFYMHVNPTSDVAEACRTLRTNLLFMSTDRSLDTLLITSAVPSEGKSTVAINTAVSMAASGKKILLVEGDMRRPRLAQSFHLDSDRGLSTWLAIGGERTDHVQPSSVDGLDVLVCGPVPPNPAELLHSKRFDALLEEAKGYYDTVIFDSPPVLPVADALILAGRVDGAFMVVRAGRTTRHLLRHSLRQLRSVQAKLLGAVLNYQETPRGGYGKSRYGYKYSYYRYGKPYGYSTTVKGDGTT